MSHRQASLDWSRPAPRASGHLPMRYFRGSILVTVVGLLLGGALGWEMSGTLRGALTTVFIVAVLGILEVSLSFDNAVVNATVLERMDPVWRRRFITWGIAIAV